VQKKGEEQTEGGRDLAVGIDQVELKGIKAIKRLALIGSSKLYLLDLVLCHSVEIPGQIHSGNSQGQGAAGDADQSVRCTFCGIHLHKIHIHI